MENCWYRFLTGPLAAAFVLAGSIGAAAPPEPVDFTRDIGPIFAGKCTHCHGAEVQKNGLRLDNGTLVLRGGDRGAAIVPGAPDESLLFQAVSGAHAELAMPPEGEEGLTDEEQALLRTWIAEGAVVPTGETAAAVQSDHWAFQPIASPEVPATAPDDWGTNSIDAFVLARLKEAGIAPSPEADRATLLRRLYLDLVGLPPTLDVLNAFLADESPDAYEKLVDCLLASPHFGERWGRHWLDLARYADTDGYEKDNTRPYAYRYRDWLIRAMNEDLPYDEFVIQQLAGDLIPDATLAQKTATGFHRNTLTNREGGIDPEEDRVKQAVDRINTTGAVFMGLTVGCAQCHTHKYDPITHREYFGMYAFFNVAVEKDIVAPLPGEEEAYAAAVQAHEAEVKAKEAELEAYKPVLIAGLPVWEETLHVPEEGWEVLDPISYSSIGGAGFSELDDRSLLLVGTNPSADTYTVIAHSDKKGVKGIRLEALTHSELAFSGPGRAHNGNFVLAELTVMAAPADEPQNMEPVEIATGTASFAQKEYPIEGAFDGDLATGWAIYNGKQTNKDTTATFTFAAPIGFDDGTIFTIKLEHRYGDRHNLGRFRLAQTAADPATILYSDAVISALQTPVSERTPEQVDALLSVYGQNDEQYKKLVAALESAKTAAPKPISSIVMTLAENPEPPVTHIHLRGDFLSPGPEVEPHTPAMLPPLKARGERPDRLDLARWIVAPENPLTARVAVNRVWEHLFGEGLNPTSEDFGTRTPAPEYVQLLDWLATQFTHEHAWSVKSLIRQIVLSSTYRQSSHVREELTDTDPANTLLARQNRFRVEAEITRDLFLATSGLLVDTVGGPSIRPPIPDGVMNLGYANSIDWPESKGADKYRRGLYIFFQRTVAYPMLMAFDCPDSNETKASRARSNTPLQALTLLNDPVFVESARALGERLLVDGPEDPAGRVRRAFKLCLGREPKSVEVDLLVALLENQKTIFASQPDAAQTLVGPYMPEGVSPEVAAAHMVLARSIMNLDEFVTRE